MFDSFEVIANPKNWVDKKRRKRRKKGRTIFRIGALL